MVELAYALIQH